MKRDVLITGASTAAGRPTMYVFGDRIRGMEDQGDAVEVTLEHGGRRRFDLVIAAEGIGSSTRSLLFGNAVQRVPLDLYTAYFTIPRGENDGTTARWFNAPGGSASSSARTTPAPRAPSSRCSRSRRGTRTSPPASRRPS